MSIVIVDKETEDIIIWIVIHILKLLISKLVLASVKSNELIEIIECIQINNQNSI